jgi:hypothetical protein
MHPSPKSAVTMLSLIGCFMISTLGPLSGIGGAQVTDSSNQGNPYKGLDNAARLAAKNDDASVRALTESVFGFPRMLPRLPDVIENTIKDRLVEAEFAYRNGAQPGVQEEDLVKLVNSFSDKLHAPSYAKTSMKQLRMLRMQLAFASPAFMASGLVGKNMSVGDSANSTMSPLQAMHLLNSLIDQKLINPAFQLEPAEWENKQAGVEMEKIKAAQEGMRGTGQGKQPRVSLTVGHRNRDLHKALLQAGSNLSFLDAMSLIDDAFTTLKMKR